MAKKKDAALTAPSSDDWELDDAERTLARAQEILADPGKLKKIHKRAGRKHKAAMSLIEPAMERSSKIDSLDRLKSRAKTRLKELDEE